MQQPVVQPEYRGHSHSCTMGLSFVSQPTCQLNKQLLSHQNIISYATFELRIV